MRMMGDGLRFCASLALLSCSFLFFSLPAQAQFSDNQFNFSILTVPKLGQLRQTEPEELVGDPILGFGAGIGLEYGDPAGLMFEIDAIYQIVHNFGFSTETYKTSAIHFPVLAKIWFIDWLNFQAGGYADIIIGDINQETSDTSGNVLSTTAVTERFRVFYYGALAGLGGRYTIGGGDGFGGGWTIRADFRYHFGISNFSDSSGRSQTLHEYVLLVGLVW